MVFTAAGAKRTGERTFEIAGQLELLGRAQPLTLTATWNKSGPSPIDKTYVMGVSARGSFKRSSYGMNYARRQRLGRRRGAAHHRVRGQAQMTAAPRHGWRRWLLRFGLPLLLLNALLTLENLGPTLWPHPAPRLSFELCMALLALTAWLAWRGAAGARACCALLAVAHRLLDRGALSRRDGVGRVRPARSTCTGTAGTCWTCCAWASSRAWQIGLAALVVLAVPVLLYALALRCWRAHRARAGAGRAPRPAIGADRRRCCCASFAAHGIGGRDTRWFFSMPVAPDRRAPGRAAGRPAAARRARRRSCRPARPSTRSARRACAAPTCC